LNKFEHVIYLLDKLQYVQLNVKSMDGIYKPNQTSIAAQKLMMPPALQYSVLQVPQWHRTVYQRVDDISCCTV